MSAARPCRLRGIDHVYLSVTDLDRSEAFYDQVMHALGLHKGDKTIAGEPHAHYLAPAFQVSLRPARSRDGHDPYAPGLHHLCFQAPSRDDVDACHASLRALGIRATAPAEYPEYHPEYYATFFEDPDGIRLEIVARTSYRQTLEDRWAELGDFLNPLQSLTARSGS